MYPVTFRVLLLFTVLYCTTAGVVEAAATAVTPVITKEPVPLTVTAGASATFSVTAKGTAPLKYQWRFNSGNITGATRSSYAIAKTSTANAGTYSVIVSNKAGMVTSSLVKLTVNPASAGGVPAAAQGVYKFSRASYSLNGKSGSIPASSFPDTFTVTATGFNDGETEQSVISGLNSVGLNANQFNLVITVQTATTLSATMTGTIMDSGATITFSSGTKLTAKILPTGTIQVDYTLAGTVSNGSVTKPFHGTVTVTFTH